jgi:hypothetical protein
LQSHPRELLLNRSRNTREARIVRRERDGENRQRSRADDPPRQIPDEWISPIFQSAPAQRQVGLGRAAIVADLAVEVLLDFEQMLVPTLLYLVLSGESEGNAEVLQFHEIDVAGRIL